MWKPLPADFHGDVARTRNGPPSRPQNAHSLRAHANRDSGITAKPVTILKNGSKGGVPRGARYGPRSGIINRFVGSGPQRIRDEPPRGPGSPPGTEPGGARGGGGRRRGAWCHHCQQHHRCHIAWGKHGCGWKLRHVLGNSGFRLGRCAGAENIAC